MGTIRTRLSLVLLAVALLCGTSGCFLNVYQTAATIPAGEWAFWWGFGALLTPGFDFEGFAPQLHVRYGLLSRLDIGLSTGLLVGKDLQGLTFLGVRGDVRYQLYFSPDISVGWLPGDFLMGGSTLSEETVYLSQSFGTLTPYGVYRLRLLLDPQLRFSHQATLGVEIFNRPKVPAIFELSWQDGRFMLGLAFRF